MQQQTGGRQPDETICLRCGTVIKRDVGLCPECGTSVSVGPQHSTPALVQHVGPQRSTPASVQHVQTQLSSGEDTIGVGRYIINFILAGFIGLIISYFLRRQGWTATWICIPVFILGLIYYASHPEMFLFDMSPLDAACAVFPEWEEYRLACEQLGGEPPPRSFR